MAMTRDSSSAFDLTSDATASINKKESKSTPNPQVASKTSKVSKRSSKKAPAKYCGARPRNLKLTDECQSALKIEAIRQGLQISDLLETIVRNAIKVE